MKYTLLSFDEKVLAALEDKDQSRIDKVNVEKREFTHILETNGKREVLLLSTGGQNGMIEIATPFGSQKIQVLRGNRLASGGAGTGSKTLKSSMPGKVLRILCKAGDKVEKDQPVLIIEAMKMENEIKSPIVGTVNEVGVKEGDKIDTGALLLKISS